MFSDMMEEAYFRLREFENLLRDLGIASVKELKRILTTNAVWEENQALKARWEKLWDWICDKKPISKGANAIFKKSEILDKMRELELADLIRKKGE